MYSLFMTSSQIDNLTVTGLQVCYLKHYAVQYGIRHFGHLYFFVLSLHTAHSSAIKIIYQRKMDRQIIALREEVSLLQQNEKDYQDLNFLYINLEHRYNALLDEKNRAENEFNRRNEFNLQTITAYRRDFELIQQQLDNEQIKYQQYEYILIENEQLLNEVNSLRDAYTKIVQQIQEQEESYQSSLQQKQQYIDNLCYQIKQLNELKQHQEKKLMTDIEQKHQQHWKADKYVSEIESYKSENEKLNQYNRQQQLQVERLEKQIKNYQEQMNALTNEMGKLQSQISSINKKQIQTGANVSDLEMKNIKALNLQLMQKNENLTLSLDTLVQNNQLLIQECDQLRNQLEQIQSKKSDVQEQYVNSLNRMQEERRVIKDYLQRQKALRETRLKENILESKTYL